MSGTQTLRMEPPATPPPPSIDPAAFRTGRDPDDAAAQLVDRVAFALAAERRTAPTADALAQLRNEATIALTSFAFRHLHNSATEIREQAIAEHRASQRKPIGFGTVFVASLLGAAVVAAGVLWLQANPAALATFVG